MTVANISFGVDGIAIHLLDSSQGHPLQTWRFAGLSTVTIGRNSDNDVTIADQHVSRLHAKLVLDAGEWTIHSLGRHGTLVNDRLVAECPLEHKTTFRLGPAGPMLRFDLQAAESRGSETIDSIQPDLLAALEIDEQRKLNEVDEITSNSLFQQLQEQSRRMKRSPAEEAKPS